MLDREYSRYIFALPDGGWVSSGSDNHVISENEKPDQFPHDKVNNGHSISSLASPLMPFIPHGRRARRRGSARKSDSQGSSSPPGGGEGEAVSHIR